MLQAIELTANCGGPRLECPERRRIVHSRTDLAHSGENASHQRSRGPVDDCVDSSA